MWFGLTTLGVVHTAISPLLPNADAPELKAIAGVLLLALVVGLALRMRWLRGRPAEALAPATAA